METSPKILFDFAEKCKCSWQTLNYLFDTHIKDTVFWQISFIIFILLKGNRDGAKNGGTKVFNMFFGWLLIDNLIRAQRVPALAPTCPTSPTGNQASPLLMGDLSIIMRPVTGSKISNMKQLETCK